MIQYDIYPNGAYYALTMSFDDGSFDDRLVKIFDKYGIRGTFHLNSTKERATGNITPESMRARYGTHEISCHGAQHLPLRNLPWQSMIEEIFEDRKFWESMVDAPVVGMSYAYGDYNQDVISCLRTVGIRYARTTRSTRAFVLPDNFMEWHPTCHYRDAAPLCDSFISWAETGAIPGNARLLYIWGHAHELERHGEWEMMESLCARLGGHENVWYATNIEIYHYVMAQRSLVISADESSIYNPSALTVWIRKGVEEYAIRSGETLHL